MIRRFWEYMWWEGPWRTSWTFGEIVDTSKFDIINGEKVPRKDYRKRLLEEKDQELKQLEEYYEKRKNEIAIKKKALLE
jgi:hypothetical protein